MNGEERVQKGTLRQVSRASGKWSWEWRYVDPENGKQKSKFLDGVEFPTRADVDRHLADFIERLGRARSDSRVVIDPTVSDLLDSFVAEENLLQIVKRKPGERAPKNNELAYSTAKSYMSLCNRIRDAWGKTKLDQLKPLAIQNWLKALEDKPKTKGHLKAFINRLFNKAKLYGMIDFQENPIGLVEVRGISKRSKKPVDLTIEQCFMILALLPEPYKMMGFTALCLGLRIEEILALAWEKIDFPRLCMQIDEAVVHGRIGPVKTEYSEDELPLDPEFATKLLDWKRQSNGGNSGLVFPSHVTGQCYHASPLQQDWIRRAGWCLVECSKCGAAPGERCRGMKQTNSKRPRIQVHDARRDAAMNAGYGGIGWHAFRHKYRTLLGGGDTALEVQQKLMRQADIRTTLGYGGVPMENRRTANSRVVRTILRRKSEE